MLDLFRKFTPLVLLQATAVNQAFASSTIVDLGYAKYQGAVVRDQISNATHIQFLGIRFAAPPTGDARFREPSLPTTVSGIQHSAPPPICFQARLGTGSTSPYDVGESILKTRQEHVSEISEDCLFLNVFVPGGGLQKDASLPVLVWIYGGGYTQGGAWNSTFGGVYNGSDVLRHSGDNVILVSIQYRLGVFGFLPGQKVKDGGALNAGLLDQQFALKWIQKHINKFGGDPQKVTIWGESAGAGAVLQQVVANGGETNPPLFRAAITSSCYLPPQYKFNDSIPEAIYKETVERTNCTSSTDSLNCLRLVDIGVLQLANVAINDRSFFGTNAYVPIVDGTFIRDKPTRLLKEKKVNGEFLYSVTNANEGSIFINPATEDTLQVDQFISQFYPTLPPKERQAAVSLYAGLGSNFSQAISIVAESIFMCPTYRLLAAFNGKGYKGLFAVPPAAHADDLNYYFPGSFTTGNTPFANAEFVNAFTESFTNFAISLNPNKKWKSNITPSWNLWRGSIEMLFNRTETWAPDIRAIKTSDILLQRCSFWESVSESTSQ